MVVRLLLVSVLMVACTSSHLKAASLPAKTSGSAQTQGTETDTIVIDPAVIHRTIPADFFGINYDAFWDPAQHSAASAAALAQTPIKVVRFPGGVPADWYDWQDPDPKHKGRVSPMTFWEWSRSFGATRALFQTNYQGNGLANPPGKSYTVNSPENAAAWVEYNKTSGISADMEVGNEEDLPTLHKKDDAAYAPYISAFVDQAKAMHQADPQVHVLGPVGTNEWFWWKLDGLGMFLRSAGNRTGSGQVDGVSLHFYRGSSWLDSMGIAQYWLSAQGPWVAIQKLIEENDTRKLPVYLTEWNLGNTDQHNGFNPTLGHALAVTDTLGAFALSGVAGADYFTIHRSDGWGLLYGAGDAKPADTATPTYYGMAMWKHMGSRMVDVKQSADPATVLSSYATIGKRGSVQVLLINKRPTSRSVEIALQGRTPAGHRLHAYTLTGSTGSVGDRDAVYNGVANPSPENKLPGPQNLGIVHGKRVKYTVPRYSAVVLQIDGTSRAASLRWPAPPPAAPAPPLKIVATGSVSQTALKAGETQGLTATISSTDDLGPGIADLEVYDSAGKKVFQQAHNITLAVNTPVTVSDSFTLSSTAWSGTYHFKVGVFGSGWAPLYKWNDSAAKFTVDGMPLPKVSATGQADPSQVSIGNTVKLSANVTSKNAGISQVVVDLEVYDPNGKRAWQGSQTGVNVPKDGTVNVTQPWTIPAGQATGNYVLKVGIFGPDWKPLMVWNNKAATFTVGNTSLSTMKTSNASTGATILASFMQRTEVALASGLHQGAVVVRHVARRVLHRLRRHLSRQ